MNAFCALSSSEATPARASNTCAEAVRGTWHRVATGPELSCPGAPNVNAGCPQPVSSTDVQKLTRLVTNTNSSTIRKPRTS